MPVPCLSRDVVVESVRIPAGVFELAGELVYAEEAVPSAAVVLAGPHPMLGGTMRNNVLRGLGDGLAHKGFACLRFDYRGVGDSTGPAIDIAQHMAAFWESSHAPNDVLLAEDLQAAVAFLISAVGPKVPLVLTGYSFGCMLLPGVANATYPHALVLIAPTVGKHDLNGFASLSQPKLVIAPEEDFAAKDDALANWFARLGSPCELIRPHLDGHFFRGHEEWLTETIADYLGCLLREDA